jgi:hypothetical protein
MKVLVACARSHLGDAPGDHQGTAAAPDLTAVSQLLLPQLLLSYNATMCPADQALLRLMQSLDSVPTQANEGAGTSGASAERAQRFLNTAGVLWGKLLRAVMEAGDVTAERLDSLLMQPSLVEPRFASSPACLRDEALRHGMAEPAAVLATSVQQCSQTCTSDLPL